MSTADFQQLIWQARALSHGDAKVALLEEAVRMADSLGDVDAGYRGRIKLVEAATFAGHQERALVAFAWCLAQSDANPGRFNAWQLMWRYKWMVGNLPSFPQIALSKMHAMLEDFHRRCREHGYGERPYLTLRWTNAWESGDFQEAKQAYREMRDTSREALTDCAACERNREVQWFAALREDEKALKLSEPIVRGRLSCDRSARNHVCAFT